jgi:3',5'-cyclic AMP phosphodiesterase CpdA
MQALLFLLSLFLFKAEKPADPPTFRFAIVSDTHIGGTPTAGEDLQRVVTDINADPDLAFAIFTGDITELGWDAELTEAYAILRQLKKPWYVIPGNHDTKWSESGNNSFRQIFGYERFHFEYGGYAFIGCSSGPNMRMAPGLVPAEDIVWLDSIITHLPENQPVLFFNHYPLDPGLGNWYKAVDILKRADTRAAFCGHGHANKAFSAEGIPSAMCRSSLRAKADTGAYNIITVTADTLFLAERKPFGKTAAAWHKIPLGPRNYLADTAHYPRPDYEANSLYPDAQLVWRLQDACDIGAGIAVAGDWAVYANTCGDVKSIYAHTGEPRWRFSAKGKIYSTPAIAAGRVVVASADSTIYCLETGNRRSFVGRENGKSNSGFAGHCRRHRVYRLFGGQVSGAFFARRRGAVGIQRRAGICGNPPGRGCGARLFRRLGHLLLCAEPQRRQSGLEMEQRQRQSNVLSGSGVSGVV